MREPDKPAAHGLSIVRRVFTRPVIVVAVVLALLALFPIFVLATDNPFLIRVATKVMIFSIATIALDLALGFGGIVTLCNAAFMGLSAYLVAIFSWHAANNEPIVNFIVSIPGSDNALMVWPVAIAVSALVAFAVGVLSLRTSGIYFIMITLAFNQMIYFFFVGLRKYGGLDGMDLAGKSQIPLINLSNRYTFYYFVLGSLAAAMLLAWKIVTSRFGVVVSGCRQNERRMQAIGYRTFRYKLAIFTISGALSAFAGVLLANSNEYVSPSDISWTHSAEFLAMVVVGGIGTIVGPIFGTAIYVVLTFALSNYTEHWEAGFGIFLMLTIVTTRSGVYGLLVPQRLRLHG
jgi:branched-chain amino acid transport system permease protein